MHIHEVSPLSWRAGAAYLYALELDGPALAWEYLRRNEDYRAQWMSQGRALPAARWGLLRCRGSDA